MNSMRHDFRREQQVRSAGKRHVGIVDDERISVEMARVGHRNEKRSWPRALEQFQILALGDKTQIARTRALRRSDASDFQSTVSAKLSAQLRGELSEENAHGVRGLPSCPVCAGPFP